MGTVTMPEETLALVETTKGFLHPDEGDCLYRWAAYAAGAGPLLEVGTYCGKSTLWIGEAARQAGQVLFCVDHHRGSPEMMPGEDCHDPEVIGDDGHDTLPFLRRTLAAADLERNVIPVVASSELALTHWSTPVAFAFIDGAHDDAGVMLDCVGWSRWVIPGGVLAFHDFAIPGIAAAIRAAEGGEFVAVDQVKSLKVLIKAGPV